MNLKDYAEQAAPLLAAINEGRTIQYRSRLQGRLSPPCWVDSTPEDEGVQCLNLDRFEYRVKPVAPWPTVTHDDADGEIVAEQYHVFPGTTLTVCALTLRNGYVVTGESAAVSPAHFNADLGQQIARRKAVEKIWPLLGFRLRDRLHAEEYPF